ncbi:MAG: AAA family ATPase [Desulfococcaceae bacterium]
MPVDNLPTFRGDGERHYAPYDPASPDLPRQEAYRAGKHLIEAVNAALFLRRPLLLEGDPGAGKTRLAYAAAHELGWPLHACYVRSSSRAEELLYEFDQLGRLYDIQAACKLADGTVREAKPLKKFRHFRPLGRAIRDAMKDRPSVVLIDEIDKADIDFPNDLLQVLEEWRFTIRENDEEKIDALKGQTVAERRDSLPLVIVTSNKERELPAAFLRRCLYFYIEFPGEKRLREIIDAHFEQGVTPMFAAALKRFLELRTAVRWRKPPGASEMLDWLRLLERNGAAGRLTKEEIEIAPLDELKHVEALLKTGEDLAALSGLVKKDD